MIGVGRDIECTGQAANELDHASVEPTATCNDRPTSLDSTQMQSELPSGITGKTLLPGPMREEQGFPSVIAPINVGRGGVAR
jgi:hypothetical protein